MLTAQRVSQLQSEYNVTETGVVNYEEAIPYGEYLAECKEYHYSNKDADYAAMSGEDKNNRIRANIQSFMKLRAVKVQGYLDNKGLLESGRLEESIFDAIAGYAVLKPALYDSDIDEIQVKDHLTLYVVRGGVEEYYVDEENRPVQFEDPEQVITVLNRLIDGGTGQAKTLSEAQPLLNDKTHEHHYRVNAVHHTVNARSHAPYDFPITMLTIRKFKEVKLTIEEIVSAGACTEQMGRFINLLGKADVRLFCVGPTASGKTTLLNSICFNIPISKSVLLIQNPTEISFFKRDQYGRNTRNVGHWEVTSFVSMSQLTSNSLRASPVVIIAGEARDSDEFLEILRLASTGHRVMGTYHAESSVDAIYRFAEETNSMDNISRITKAIDAIITQFKFDDGFRRVMELAEILGTKDNEPQINILFEFVMSGKTKKLDNGRIFIEGDFVHRNAISENLLNKFYKAGVALEEIAEFVSVEMGGTFAGERMVS